MLPKIKRPYNYFTTTIDIDMLGALADSLSYFYHVVQPAPTHRHYDEDAGVFVSNSEEKENINLKMAIVGLAKSFMEKCRPFLSEENTSLVLTDSEKWAIIQILALTWLTQYDEFCEWSYKNWKDHGADCGETPQQDLKEYIEMGEFLEIQKSAIKFCGILEKAEYCEKIIILKEKTNDN